MKTFQVVIAVASVVGALAMILITVDVVGLVLTHGG
jgi:hypothetical protein